MMTEGKRVQTVRGVKRRTKRSGGGKPKKNEPTGSGVIRDNSEKARKPNPPPIKASHPEGTGRRESTRDLEKKGQKRTNGRKKQGQSSIKAGIPNQPGAASTVGEWKAL